MPGVLGEIVPDVGTKVWESVKAMGLGGWSFGVSDEEQREQEGM